MVAMRQIYRVEIERGRTGRWWLIDVPEVPAAHSQARRLDQAEDVARDLIALLTDADPGSFDVNIRVELPAEVRADLDRAEELRQDAARSQHDDGLPLRDIGKLLHVSHQRAHQLVDEARERLAG
jgi:DNA-directed RNA polymerase specialized sigma24 family protein